MRSLGSEIVFDQKFISDTHDRNNVRIVKSPPPDWPQTLLESALSDVHKKFFEHDIHNVIDVRDTVFTYHPSAFDLDYRTEDVPSI